MSFNYIFSNWLGFVSDLYNHVALLILCKPYYRLLQDTDQDHFFIQGLELPEHFTSGSLLKQPPRIQQQQQVYIYFTSGSLLKQPPRIQQQQQVYIFYLWIIIETALTNLTTAATGIDQVRGNSLSLIKGTVLDKLLGRG